MNGLIMMIKHNLRFMIIKKKMSFIITIIIPIIAVLLTSKILIGSSNGLKVGVINTDNSKASNYIVSLLDNNDSISTVKNTSINELNTSFSDNSVQAAIVIDKGFEKGLTEGKIENIKIIGKDGDGTYKIVKGIVSSNLDNMLRLGSISKGNENNFNTLLSKYEKSSLNIKRENIANLNLDYTKTAIFIGFLIMFIFYRAMFGAERVNEDREEKVFTRVFVSSIKPWQYYGGNVIASLVGISIQIVLAVLVVKNVANLNFGMSNLVLCTILILAGLVAVSVGTVCISITRDSQEAALLSNIVVLMLVMIGGCFIPVSVFPAVMNTISKFLPTRWILDMIYNIQNGQSFMLQWHYIIMVLLLSFALLLLSAYFTKRKDKSFLEI
ncbi:ABC transporter permease [uncultured Clostridium sp.]|uniref:ABC transporter permease n=1 Tax=uncultured Clostridium sp. TaxID=59620 RepID=UPI00262E3B9E|nr:ABC transporter permease [uncultured Clostridium sp.]